MEELHYVLWAHRTMIKSSNGYTPFSLTYGTEAVIPAEIGMPTRRTAKVDLVKNNEALEINLDLLEELREQAAIQDTGKLGPKWEGMYEVTEALGKGAYKLRDRDEKQIPRTWNVPQDYDVFSAMTCLFIHVIYAISLSLYPFTERYAHPYSFHVLIRQTFLRLYVSELCFDDTPRL
nr:hypothetical protein [Tanacetum cinerariifolium]